MDYLLDTHVLLWIIFDSDKLSPLAQKIILDKSTHCAPTRIAGQ